jgi:hypothetical protein
LERKIVYFENIGPQNTEITFRSVKERLNEPGIEKIVIASTTGATARMANDYFKDIGIKLIVIPHQYDFHREVNLFPGGLVKELKDAGHDVHFGTMLFHTDQLYDSSTPTLMANILRCFCQGVKVCFEIVMMAADAGLVSKGEKVIAIAGTGRGADTALIMQASSSQNMKKLRVNEIICKPLYPLNIDEALSKVPPKR